MILSVFDFEMDTPKKYCRGIQLTKTFLFVVLSDSKQTDSISIKTDKFD